ncbi:MAG TPA: hypothetical protein VHN18_18730 [Micromonosporaceae bacterium]|nr:hypothetical protein [Micromonosporaceae bacterium]
MDAGGQRGKDLGTYSGHRRAGPGDQGTQRDVPGRRRGRTAAPAATLVLVGGQSMAYAEPTLSGGR